MSYLSENRVLVDFQSGVTPTQTYNVIKNDVTFYSNTIIDLSAFNFIDKTYLKHNFYDTKSDSYTEYFDK